MNWLDIIIIIIVAIFIFIGFGIGIIRAALSLAGVIVGVVLAGSFYVPLSGLLSFIPQTRVAEVVAFLIILIAVIIIASLLARLLRWAISAVMLGWVDRLGGAIFGLVLGAILGSALLVIWGKFFDVAGVISQSSLAVILLDRFPAVLALLPDEFDAVRSFFR